MIRLTKSDVPRHLQDSEFYENLSGEEGESFTLSVEYFRLERRISSLEDLAHSLSTLRFWGARSYFQELLEFVWSHEVAEYEIIFADYWNELTYLKHFIRIMYARAAYRMNIALDINDVKILNFLIGKGFSFNECSPTIAARNGNLAALQLMRTQPNLNQKFVLHDAMVTAAQYGHINDFRDIVGGSLRTGG